MTSIVMNNVCVVADHNAKDIRGQCSNLYDTQTQGDKIILELERITRASTHTK